MRKPCKTSERRSSFGVSDTNLGLLAPTRPVMSAHPTVSRRSAQEARSAANRSRSSVMTRFIVHTTQSAPAASRPLLEGIERTFGFVPNLFSVFAESPAALGARHLRSVFQIQSLENRAAARHARRVRGERLRLLRSGALDHRQTHGQGGSGAGRRGAPP